MLKNMSAEMSTETDEKKTSSYRYRSGFIYAPVLHRPMTWRRKIRRAFLLTAPISVPVWLGLIIIKIAIVSCKEMSYPIRRMWNGSTHRKRSYYSR